MATDLKAIADDKIRKWQLFRELADDPEFAVYLRGLTNGDAPKQTPAVTHPAVNGSNGATRPRGFFVGAVLGVIAKLEHEFTTDDVERKLRDLGIEIRAANPNIAVNEALRTLEQRGDIERTKKRNGMRLIWRKTLSPRSSAVESRTA